jgi:cytosine/uracil/thiamine/allantoin permease
MEGPLEQNYSGPHSNSSGYDIFAFCMSDVHSVHRYAFAARLFSLGLRGWQVLVSLLFGVAVETSWAAGVPYPVVRRLAFGVFGATATKRPFGTLLRNPIETLNRVDTTFAVVTRALTIVIDRSVSLGVLAGFVLSFRSGFFATFGVLEEMSRRAWFAGALCGGLAYGLFAEHEETELATASASQVIRVRHML